MTQILEFPDTLSDEEKLRKWMRSVGDIFEELSVVLKEVADVQENLNQRLQKLENKLCTDE